VLGCVLLSPDHNLGRCIEKFKGQSTVFYDLRHRTLFEVLVEMFDRREPIDTLTVLQRLKDRGLMDKVGGAAYVSSLPDTVPSAAHLEFYADIVREKFILRRIISVCTEAINRVYEYEGDAESLLDQVECDVLRVTEALEESGAQSIRDLVKKAITTIEEYHSRGGMLTGLATGFKDLDALTHGLHPGEMIVIAARPSMGKTSLALNIAEHVAVDQGVPVAVFSLEMTAEALATRLICSRARIDLHSLRHGILRREQVTGLTAAADLLSKAPLFIDDSAGLSILQLRAKARRLYQQHQIRLFVIDYLQLLHSTARRIENRQQEIADISSGIKALAKELNVPVVVLSQLNREVERERGRKPRLSDLRESGAIEQDADVVGLLYRPAAEDDDDGVSDDVVQINLLIAKQRNGPTGEVPLVFLRNYTRFEDATKDSDATVPPAA
jgi:replicative DNA helicase